MIKRKFTLDHIDFRPRRQNVKRSKKRANRKPTKTRDQGRTTHRRSLRRAAQTMPGFYNETVLTRRAHGMKVVVKRVEKKKHVMVRKVVCSV